MSRKQCALKVTQMRVAIAGLGVVLLAATIAHAQTPPPGIHESEYSQPGKEVAWVAINNIHIPIIGRFS